MMYRTPKLKNPIIFIHGLLGFGDISIGQWKIKSYFPGIREYLHRHGNRVLLAHVHPTRSIRDRATQLKRFINDRFGSEPVHLIGHSMGGLDARFMINQLGMENQVISLTSIGTPHRGSYFADWGIRHLSRVLSPILNYFHIPAKAFYDLTTEQCSQFNEKIQDIPSVRYFSVAGKISAPLLGLEWRLSSKLVGDFEGENDGVVSVRSAKYGEWCEIWDADHMNLINWPNRHAKRKGIWQDRSEDYGRLIEKISLATEAP